MEITGEEFDAVVAVNLRGTFFGCQVFGAHFRDRGHGRIDNLASLAGQNGGNRHRRPLRRLEGGDRHADQSLRPRSRAHGVTVNAVAPGPLDLPAVHRTVTPERLAEITRTIPVGGIGDAGFVGDMIVQLASPRRASPPGRRST